MPSINEVVTVLSPIFAAAASWLTAWVATNVPGAPHLDPGSVRDIMIAAAAGAFGMVFKYLHGNQQAARQAAAPSADVVRAMVRAELRLLLQPAVTPAPEAPQQ